MWPLTKMPRTKMSYFKNKGGVFSSFWNDGGNEWCRCLIILLAAVLFTIGCSSAHKEPGFKIHGRINTRVDDLTKALAEMGPPGSVAEASLIAETALERAMELRKENPPVGPALLNNVAINMGLNDRGLCYHWANDILESLEALELNHFELHWATSAWGERFTEHNAIVVTAYPDGFHQGIVLDGWRKGGRLVWAKVEEDRKYRWEKLSEGDLKIYRPRAKMRR